MRVYDQKEVCDIFSKYVRVYFNTAKEAAANYECTDQFISNIKKYLASPNEQMLKDIGFVRKNGFIKAKG